MDCISLESLDLPVASLSADFILFGEEGSEHVLELRSLIFGNVGADLSLDVGHEIADSRVEPWIVIFMTGLEKMELFVRDGIQNVGI